VSEQDPRQPTTKPRTSPQPDGGRDTGEWVRIGLIAAAVIYGLLLLILNSKRVKLDFLFFEANARLWLLLLLTLALGAVAGFVGARLYDRRRRS
jgi:uncharacterized integral membrane protein